VRRASEQHCLDSIGCHMPMQNGFLTYIRGLFARRVHAVWYLANDNGLPCVVVVEHFVENLSSDRMVWCAPMETLQGIYSVRAPNEEKCSVFGVNFCHINAVEVVQTVG
jgi:hypothetical protein